MSGQLLIALGYGLLLLGTGAAGASSSADRFSGRQDLSELMAFAASGLPPAVPLLLLGVAWGASHALLWGLFPTYCPPSRLAVAAGYSGVAINIGPALVPLALR